MKTLFKAGAAPRALIGFVRADASDPKALFEQLNAAATAMKSEIADLKAKVDPLDSEKIDRMNDEISALIKTQNELNAKVAAGDLGAGAGGVSAKDRDHAEQFGIFARRGIEAVQARGSTFSDPDGGFLTPPQIDLAITRVVGATVAMRRLANIITISGEKYVMHKSVGGASAGWVGEGDTRSETDTPTLKRMEFVPGELYAEPAATQHFLDDVAANVETWYAGEVAQTFAEYEGAAFISGNGTKKPQGILSYTPVANASYAWGNVGFVTTGDADSFPAAANGTHPGSPLIGLQHALKQGYRQNGSFLMNDSTFATIRKMTDTTGQLMWEPSLKLGEPMTLLGKPVETDDNMADIAADTYPVAFADWKQAYTIVDRLGIRILRNPYKTNGVVFFYSTKRVGGGISNFEAIKLLKIAA